MFDISRLMIRKFKAVAALLAFAGAASTLVAQTGPAPVLIPYTVNVLAGNPQQTTGGYSGDGSKAVGTTLNGNLGIAIDPEGNLYIADTSNAIIREVNAQTGVIKIIAGLPPTKCALTLCTAQSGYTDGVLATSVAMGTGMQGIAVDGNGNVFFGDYNQQVVRVIYKGGTQVANLIALEDPTAAASASAVIPGYVYTIAGQNGVKSPVTDKVLATKGTMHDPGSIELDGAGNIYFLDFGNNSIRVINAQSTTQTFFGVSLAPGFMGAIVNCGSLTSTCGSSFTGIPAGSADYGADLSVQGLAVDQFGNVYEVNTKGAAAIFGGVAYNGSAALGKLLTLITGNAPVAGDFYNVINGNPALSSIPAIPLTSPFPTAALANQYNNIVLRASAITVDPKGNIYYLDNHFPWIFRVDVNSQVATRLTGFSTGKGTPGAPAVCSTAPVFPVVTTSTTTTTDTYGDGCPAVESVLSGYGAMTTDAQGNLYLSDSKEYLIRQYSVDNQFPATPVGTPISQVLQVHFDQNNLPATTTATLTSPLAIQTGDTDFSITTAPTCQSNTISLQPPTQTTTGPLDGSIDCVVTVTFNPTQPGLRTGSLQATSASGAVYNFQLTGTGTGAELVLDGGGQTVVSAAGLGAVTGVAVDAVGNQYIADPTNNRVVVLSSNGTQTTIGTGLSAPQSVAVDAAGDVYIADTGNNRVVEVSSATGNAQTVLGNGLKAPQGVAVDANMNVYVADTGNARVVEIPADTAQAQAVLFQFNMTTPVISKPVAVAVDSLGNVYVSDIGQKAIFEFQPGGGDLQNIVSTATTFNSKDSNISAPGGLAVDAAGNVYVSDDNNNVVTEIPSSSGPGSAPFNLSFTGLSNPGGLALDPFGNLYVADTGNSRVVLMNRTSPSVNYGSLGVFQPAQTVPLVLSNIGNIPITLGQPVYSAAGSTGDFSQVDGCSGVLLYNGLTCTVSSSFLPVAKGSYSESLAFQGGITANLQGVGVAPLANITVAFGQAPALGSTTASVIATVTQPHGINTPTGSVTFVYTINEGNTARGGSTTTVNVPLVAGSNGAATATLNLTGLQIARRYSIVATYNGDAGDSANAATALTFTVPGGTTLNVVSSSVSFAYGTAVPALTGTVTGILPADAASITYQFTTAASPTTPVGTYPITLLLSGGNYLNYVVPPAVTSTGAPAVVTETPAPLSVKVNNASVVYGSQNISPSSVITGAVNGDSFTVTYTPAATSVLDVGTYTLVPTVTGPVGNYNVSITNGTLTVTQAPTSISVSANASSVLPTNLASEQVAITLGSGVSNKAIPSGTVTLIDTFTPFSTGVANAPVNIGPLTLTNGTTTYTPTSMTLGTHVYTVNYNGSLDFATSSNTSGATVIVDNPDFFVTAPSTPIVVIPGTIPGGNAAISGESAANPEQATVTIAPILNYTGTITLSCSSPSSYVTCSFATPTVLLNTTTAQTDVISVQTPATLPINYGSGAALGQKLDLRFALTALGVLAMLPLARRRKVTRLVWLIVFGAIMSLSLSGCTATNLVKFYTPVPEGEQPLTITATDGTITKTTTITISIQ